MDTGTHILFGLGIGGLAMIDPAITAYTYGPIAIVIGTIAGSNAPDLDSLIKFKSKSDYIKNHRGLSHSFPAIVGWAILIATVISLFFPEIPWLHVGMWVLLAVIIHVFTDLFNPYGTQAFRPISRKRVAWNIIHIFDPFIFTSHLFAIVLWITGFASPQVIFPTLYTLLVSYYSWRMLVHRRLSRRLPHLDPEGQSSDRYTLIPTLSLYRWNVVRLSKDNTYRIGEWDHGKLKWIDRLSCEEHPAIAASMQHPNIQAFLSVTASPCGSVTPHGWGYEVRWIDVRFRYRTQYAFVAIVIMDLSFAPLESYVGWLGHNRLERRHRKNTY